jgi:hypothetical protein
MDDVKAHSANGWRDAIDGVISAYEFFNEPDTATIAKSAMGGVTAVYEGEEDDAVKGGGGSGNWGHRGRPGHRGGSAPGAGGGGGGGMGEFEEGVRDLQTHEEAALFDADGNLLFRKSGGDTSVSYTRDEVGQFNGAVLTHNHPGGGSFSPSDVETALMHGLREIRAVDTNYTYVLRNNLSGPDMMRTMQVSKAAHEHIQRNIGDWREKVVTGSVSTKHANQEFWHDTWATLQANMGGQSPFTYERIARNG